MATDALKSAVENESWMDSVKAIESFFKKELGYVKVKSCECEEYPSDEDKKRLKEKADIYQKRFHQEYKPKDDERLYATHVRCLHFRHPKIEEGIISSIEGNQELTGYILGSVKNAIRKGLGFGIISKKLHMGPPGVLMLANQERKNIHQIVSPGIVLGIVNFHAYGDKYTGKMEKTDFECCDGRKWGERIGSPPVVKSVNLSQLQT